jgi:hypothetical protein
MQYKNLTFFWCWAWCLQIETNIWEGISGVYLELGSNEMQEKVTKYDVLYFFFVPITFHFLGSTKSTSKLRSERLFSCRGVSEKLISWDIFLKSY